ncbi:hypothetical protein BDW75DRAFT_228680 [Aspergillus navahoensis]
MPGRRPHTKSRAGCQRCKEKHVKCDEVRPTCGACARYGVPCIGLPALSLLPSPSGRTTLTLWESELIHHWILHVTESFQVSPGFRPAWCDRGIRVAIHYDFFLHTILMLSALHLALTESSSFTEGHRAFILEGCSDATTRFRKEAEIICVSNCHAVGLPLPHTDREPLARVRVSPRWMEEKDFLDQTDEDNCDTNLGNALGTLQRWIDSSDDDPRVRSLNSDTVQLFRETLKVHLKRSLRPLSWRNAIHSEFIDLRRQRNPMALVILTHYAVILGQRSELWWCSKRGLRLLSVIAAMLPRKNQEAVTYPRQMLNPGSGQ